MTITATFEEVSGGTEVTLVCNNLPPGLRAEDNEAGSRLSLQQLAPLRSCGLTCDLASRPTGGGVAQGRLAL